MQSLFPLSTSKEDRLSRAFRITKTFVAAHILIPQCFCGYNCPATKKIRRDASRLHEMTLIET